MNVLRPLLQGLVLLLIAPLATGLVRQYKARLQGRKGASAFLPYIRLATLLRKEMVISKTASWVFHIVPFGVFTSCLLLACSLPLLFSGSPTLALDHFMLIAALFALSAIFLVLGGLDTGSAFGGMGASRELTIATLVEPATMVIFITFALVSGSAHIGEMLQLAGSNLLIHPYLLLSILALIMVALAENARYPVDNPATHLELTMVHEAMILDYSGSYLALLEYASSLKLATFALLCANFIIPSGLFPMLPTLNTMPIVILSTLIKILIVMFLLALLETSIPKMRFYRMQEYLSYAFLLGLSGFTFALLHFA